MGPKYPQLQIQLHSSNPFALVSAVRLAMRRSRIDAQEIDRFTEEALRREEPQDVQAVCASWADIEVV